MPKSREVTWSTDPVREQAMLQHRYRINPGALPIDQTKAELEKVLPQLGYITFSQSHFNYRMAEGFNIRYVQLGERYDIFAVTVSTQQEGYNGEFIMVVSQGGEQRDKELMSDYRNLNRIHTGLAEARLPIFVPKPFIANDGSGFFPSNLPCFSVEYLKDHAELNSRNLLEIASSSNPYAYFIMHSHNLDFDSDDFSSMQQIRKDYLLEAIKNLPEGDPNIGYEIGNSLHYRTARRIKEELASRLFLVYQVLSAAPKDLLINAGDFMANPNAPAFDLKLTTLRGGLVELPDQEAFRDWALKHREHRTSYATSEVTEYPLFDNNPLIIDRGIKLARELIRKGRSHILGLIV